MMAVSMVKTQYILLLENFNISLHNRQLSKCSTIFCLYNQIIHDAPGRNIISSSTIMLIVHTMIAFIVSMVKIQYILLSVIMLEKFQYFTAQ